MRRWPNTSHQKVISIVAKWHSGKNYFGPPSRSKSRAVVGVVEASGAGWWVSGSTWVLKCILLITYYFGPVRSKSQAVVEVVGASGAGWWVSSSTWTSPCGNRGRRIPPFTITGITWEALAGRWNDDILLMETILKYLLLRAYKWWQCHIDVLISKIMKLELKAL